ncbi:aminopeptidase P family protein [Lactobacillus sp. LL6]|uniref:M24 family metallopeptidase n=1 Tax=Lactobacillus sp. LL6 TaxID=2596827 RepID=UPI001185EA67|nr:aminopeptidase P family protein [Lactobacillus sp. LL6]TSO26527.1 aminopeptidase P family protein [Lactobacillus sp. LL6]
MSKEQELLSLINQRILKTTNLIKKEGADALIIYSEPNYRYLTNFTGEEAQLILTAAGDRILLSDSRFADQIKAQAPGELNVIMKHNSDYEEISKILKTLNLKKVLIEGEFVSATEYEKLKQLNPELNFEICEELVEQVRNVKDKLEIEALKKAINISMESFNEILPMIKVGAKEKDIAAKLDYLFKINGGDGPDFDTIVASGLRSAWAHGVASDKIIEDGDMIVIDFGSFYNGYAADITRTVSVGKVDPELKKIYEIVLEAQRRGIEKATRGNYGRDVDQAAREYIAQAGYGQYFGHGIGHGIGLELHELCQPSMPFAKQKLTDNMIHTVEPGIYLPEKGGVRIEDDVLINGEEPEVLSNLPKNELLSL